MERFEELSSSEAAGELLLPSPAQSPPARAWVREKSAALLERPWLIAAFLVVAVAALTGPWGDYPVNDDWQYARAAQRLATRGEVVIDTNIAPSLVGALFFAWPFIKVFGFSHVLLRLLTIGLSQVTLFALDALMDVANVAKHVRLRVLLLVAINPLFVNLAFSFMTELYGFTPALLGAVIWFRSRRSREEGRGALIGVGAALATGVLVGSTFWTRQYCVLVYPALVASTLFQVWRGAEWQRLRNSLLALFASAAAFVVVVAAYFAYASAYGLLKRAFSGPLGGALHFSLSDYQIVASAYVFYMTAFFYPLLLTWPLSERRGRRYLRAGGFCLAFVLTSYTIVQLAAGDDWGSVGTHRLFPFLSNIIHNAGVGPNTLTDGFFHRADGYFVMPRRLWRSVTYAVVALSTLWGFVLVALPSLRRAPRLQRELAAFGAAFALLSLVAVVQAYGSIGFDRYALPFLFGAGLVFACLNTSDEASLSRPKRLRDFIRKWSSVPFALSCLPLAYFTVAGVHDYFRWNDTRWRLVEYAMSTGIPSTSIDGGYEVNGWLSYDIAALHQGTPEQSRCIGECRCDVPNYMQELWNCYDESYRLGMSTRDGYVEVTRETPRSWLGQPQAIILSRRPD